MSSFVLPVDKPIGPTSHDIVSIARRALGTKRIGHAGTLDPFASGLLLLCVERGTRLAEYLSDLPKTYRAVAHFDGRTTTDDRTGERVTTSDSWRTVSEATLRDAFERQRGTILQKPSSFSAKKVAGERAYDLARRGSPVELEPKAITIYQIRLIIVLLPMVEFEVECSSGTYVRAIARDIGEDLGTGGYLTELRRTRIGQFDVANALIPDALFDDDVVRARRVSLLDAVPQFERVEVTDEDARRLRLGQTIERSSNAGSVALARAGELIAIGVADGERIKPRKVFPHD